MRKFRIPEKSHHPIVEDNLTHFYHIPVLRSFFIKRLSMTLDLLGDRKFQNILEIGVGSGVMLHELSKMSKNVFACDLHPHLAKVKRMAEKENLSVHFSQGSITDLPYKDRSFDCVISVATIEHIHGLSKAISEMKRILTPQGVLALGFPVETKITDFLLIAAGSTKAYRQKLREIHPNSHTDILREMNRQFGQVKAKRLPFFLPEAISLYYSCMGEKGIRSNV